MNLLRTYLLSGVLLSMVLPLVCMEKEENISNEDIHKVAALFNALLPVQKENITLQEVDNGSETITQETEIPLLSTVSEVDVKVPLKWLRYSETLEHLLADTGITLTTAGETKAIVATRVPHVGAEQLRFIFNDIVPCLAENRLDLAELCANKDMAYVVELLLVVNYLDIKHDLLDKIIRYCAQQVASDPIKNSIKNEFKKIPMVLLHKILKELAVLRVYPLVETEALVVCKGHTDLVTSVCVVETEQGLRIISGSFDGTIRIWDMKTGEQTGEYKGHTDLIRSLHAIMTKDGGRVISSDDGTIHIWDMKTGQLVRDCQEHVRGDDNVITSVCVAETEEGLRIISGGYHDGTIRILDMKTGTEVVEFKAHNHCIISLCVVNTQEGWRIISGSIEGAIRIWDMKTGQKVGECKTNVKSVCAVETHEGWRIISGSRNGNICIWDMRTGQQLAVFKGHTDSVISVCAVKTEERWFIISSSLGETICICDMETGKPVGVCKGHADLIRSLHAIRTEEGLRIISGSDDETVRVWGVLGFMQKFKHITHVTHEQAVKIYDLLMANDANDTKETLYAKLQDLFKLWQEELKKCIEMFRSKNKGSIFNVICRSKQAEEEKLKKCIEMFRSKNKGSIFNVICRSKKTEEDK